MFVVMRFDCIITYFKSSNALREHWTVLLRVLKWSLDGRLPFVCTANGDTCVSTFEGKTKGKTMATEIATAIAEATGETNLKVVTTNILRFTCMTHVLAS